VADATAGQQRLASLNAKLTRAVTELNLASLDAGSAEDKSMQQAKSKLGAAKAALLQMHLALQSQQKSDTIAISNEVTTGISALQDSVTAAIRESAQQIQAALDTQVAKLGSQMEGLGSKVSSATHELETKMDALVTSEAAHDAKQEHKIAAITASLSQGSARVQVREEALVANISMVQRLMLNGMELLDATTARDKPQLLSQVASEVDAAKQKLDEVIKDTQDELKHSVKTELRAEAQSVDAERAAMAVKENLLDAEIARLSRGDTRFDAQWATDVNTIDEDLRRVRNGAHRNNTRIQTALHASEGNLQKEQREAYGERERAQDRREFSQVENRDQERFQVNITADVREEKASVERRMRERERGFDERAHTAFAGPKDREGDLKGNLRALARKVKREFDTRDQQIAAINFTSGAWIASSERQLSRMAEAAGDAVRSSRNAKTRSFQRIQHMKDRLATLLRSVRDLTRLRAQIEAAAARTDNVAREEESDYQGVAEKRNSIASEIAGWREQLQNAIGTLGSQLNT